MRSRWLDPARPRPLVVAHRGDSAHAPENTLEAGLLGHRAGADAWELDVQLTRDGVPVVIHDAGLARTTDAALRFASDPRASSGLLVADFDLAEVRALDAGSWFTREAGGPRSARAFGTLERLPPSSRERFGSGSVQVPTLAEALELTRELGWLVNVELKGFPEADPRLVRAALELVAASGVADRVLISSFDHSQVFEAARSGLGIACGVLTTAPLCRPGDYVRDIVGADFYHPSAEAVGASSADYLQDPRARHLRRADVADVPSLVYTVNDDRLAVHLAEAGAAGLFTDRPSTILRRFGRPGRSSDPIPRA